MSTTTIETLRLPVLFDPSKLRRDLDGISDDQWTAHFNKDLYTGEWSGIALRKPADATGSIIEEHTDHELSFEHGEVRIHIPVLTSPHVEFYVGGKRIQMEEGETWYLNANVPHRVSNAGPTDRVHLVMDCLVNQWVESMFQRAMQAS